MFELFLMVQESNKIRSLNLSNSQKHIFEVKNSVKMPNLHFLILYGCEVGGNIGSISKELQWLP